MVVVDEKAMLPPPPSYSLTRTHPNVPESLHPPPFSAPFRTLANFSDLPSHLLLHIVHRTFPQAPDKSYNKLERQRKTLRWLTMSLRLVNRTFYIGTHLYRRISMEKKRKHVLFSLYARTPLDLPPFILLLHPAPLHIRPLPTHPDPI